MRRSRSGLSVLLVAGMVSLGPAVYAKGDAQSGGQPSDSQTSDAQSTGAQTTEQLPRTLFTLGVTQSQAQKILFAVANGELALGLQTDGSKINPDSGATAQNLFK